MSAQCDFHGCIVATALRKLHQAHAEVLDPAINQLGADLDKIIDDWLDEQIQ